MIDTVVLTLPIHHFRITCSGLFQPDAKWLYTAPYIAQVNGVCKCVQNPTKEDAQNGIYKPRLTLMRRWDGTKGMITLKIEFSVPKLCFWNNFDELSDGDFSETIKRLKDALSDMWIAVIDGKLEKAIVSTVHYGKNIVLDDYTSVNRVLSLIAKTKISERFDANKTEYQNGWELFRLHTKSFQIVLYDKIADLRKTEARWVDKDMKMVNYQMSLFEDIRRAENKKNWRSFDVLRLEIRFLNKTKLKSVFKELRIPFSEPLTFRDIFCMEHARRIVECFWNQIMLELKMLEFLEIDSVQRFAIIFGSKHIKTPTKALALAMLSELLSNEDHRTVRKQFDSRFNKRTLTRLYSELRNVQTDSKAFSFVPVIERQLKAYNPLQIWKYMYPKVN